MDASGVSSSSSGCNDLLSHLADGHNAFPNPKFKFIWVE